MLLLLWLTCLLLKSKEEQGIEEGKQLPSRCTPYHLFVWRESNRNPTICVCTELKLHIGAYHPVAEEVVAGFCITAWLSIPKGFAKGDVISPTWFKHKRRTSGVQPKGTEQCYWLHSFVLPGILETQAPRQGPLTGPALLYKQTEVQRRKGGQLGCTVKSVPATGFGLDLFKLKTCQVFLN